MSRVSRLRLAVADHRRGRGRDTPVPLGRHGRVASGLGGRMGQMRCGGGFRGMLGSPGPPSPPLSPSHQSHPGRTCPRALARVSNLAHPSHPSHSVRVSPPPSPGTGRRGSLPGASESQDSVGRAPARGGSALPARASLTGGGFTHQRAGENSCARYSEISTRCRGGVWNSIKVIWTARLTGSKSGKKHQKIDGTHVHFEKYE